MSLIAWKDFSVKIIQTYMWYSFHTFTFFTLSRKYIYISSWTTWPLKIGRTGYPASIKHYKCMMHINPDEWTPHIYGSVVVINLICTGHITYAYLSSTVTFSGNYISHYLSFPHNNCMKHIFHHVTTFQIYWRLNNLFMTG